MRRVVVVMVAALACAVTLPVVAPPAAGAVLQVTTPGPDFNNDGFADLAVGAPGEDVGAATDACAVNVLYGSAGGLGGAQVLTQGAGGVPGASESLDRFGTALTTGNFNADGFADLAVGVPGEDLGAVADAGILDVLYGTDAAGLGGGGSEQLTQDAAGTAEPGDRFGEALSEPFFFLNDVLEDVAIGAPGETVNGRGSAGAGSVLFGADPGGLGDGGGQFFFQGGGLGGVAESVDQFGAAFS